MTPSAITSIEPTPSEVEVLTPIENPCQPLRTNTFPHYRDDDPSHLLFQRQLIKANAMHQKTTSTSNLKATTPNLKTTTRIPKRNSSIPSKSFSFLFYRQSLI